MSITVQTEVQQHNSAIIMHSTYKVLYSLPQP